MKAGNGESQVSVTDGSQVTVEIEEICSFIQPTYYGQLFSICRSIRVSKSQTFRVHALLCSCVYYAGFFFVSSLKKSSLDYK